MSWKKTSAWLVFLILFPLVFSSPLRAQASASRGFAELVTPAIDAALRGRDGLILLRDHSQSREWVWGNSKLLTEKFLPGSTIKLVTAEAALAEGRLPRYYCAGHDRIGGKKMHCWTHHGHGELDFSRALSVSCNLYFAQLGVQLGTPTLLAALRQAGFSGVAGVDPGKLKESRLARLAIGDDPDFRVTPRELLDYWQGLLERLAKPEGAPIAQALRRSVGEGTGRKAEGELTILGKTGTSDALRTAYKTDGWFLSAYPVERPRWALLVFLKQAHGFDEAAELAGKIWRTGGRTGFLDD